MKQAIEPSFSHIKQSEQTTSTCPYRCENGMPCGGPVEEGQYCKWHESEQVLTDPSVKLHLQIHAEKVKHMYAYQLARADLHGIDLVNHGEKEGYSLIHSDLYRTNLRGAHLYKLDLSNSSLMKANLKGANMHSANLSNANLLGVILDKASLDGIIWGEHVLQENLAHQATEPREKQDLYHEAEEVYRNLRIVHDNQGYGLLAGHFFRREMIMRRHQIPVFSLQRFLSKLLDIFSGYGEQPFKVVMFSVATILSFAVMYALLGVSYEGVIISMRDRKSVV